MADFNDILSLINTGYNRSNPVQTMNVQTNEPQFNPIPPEEFKRASPSKPVVSDSLKRIQAMQKRLNIAQTQLKESTMEPTEQLLPEELSSPQVNIAMGNSRLNQPPQYHAEQQPEYSSASPTVERFTDLASLNQNIKQPEKSELQQKFDILSRSIRQNDARDTIVGANKQSEPPQVEEEVAIEESKPQVAELQDAPQQQPSQPHTAGQNRLAKDYSEAINPDLHQTDLRQIDVLQRQIQELEADKSRLKAENDQLQTDVKFYKQKSEELQKQLNGRGTEPDPAMRGNIEQNALQQRDEPEAQGAVQVQENVVQAPEIDFQATQNFPDYSQHLKASVSQPKQTNCFKILLPEGTQVREQAAKRLVEVTNDGIKWSRFDGGVLKQSGILLYSNIVHCLFGSDAAVFRSKVLAARRAGYCNSVMELIQSGILDQIEAKNIGGDMGVVLFEKDKILVFELENKREFDEICAALEKAGL